MQSFNGKLKISSVTIIDNTTPQQWTVDVTFQSADGFTSSNIKVNDIVLLNGYSEDNDVWQFCKYSVMSISDSPTKGHKTLVLQFNDTSTDVYAPSIEEPNNIALIGRLTSDTGFIMLPTVADGVDNANIQKARNIDLSNRDVNFTTYVKQLVKDSIPSDIGGTDDTKLPIAGGTITGNLKVNGSTDVAQFTATSGKNSVLLNTNGLTTTIESDFVTDKKTVLSSGDVSASVSRVSTNGVSNFTDRVNGTVAKRVEETSASNGVTNEVDVKSSNGTSTYVVNTTGNDTNVQLNSQSTSGVSKLNLTASSETSTSEINLTAQKINLNGSSVVNGGLNVSGDISTNNGTITAKKYLSSSTEITPDDNQLITSAYLKDYVSKNGGSNVDTSQFITESGLSSKLADYAKISTLQDKVDTSVNLKFTEYGNADNITDGQTNHFVTEVEKIYWNAKQDAIDTSVFEQTIKKGVANGYAPLNNDRVVPRQFLDLPDMSAIETPVATMSEAMFIQKYNYEVDASKLDSYTYTKSDNTEKTITATEHGLSGNIRMGNLQGTLFLVASNAPDIKLDTTSAKATVGQDNVGTIINDWRFIYVYKASPDDCFEDCKTFSGKIAQWPGQQIAIELGTYDSTNRKIVSWSNLVTDTMPQAVKDLVAKVDGSTFVNDNLKDMLSGTTTINGIEFDKKGRATGTHSVIDKSALPSDIVYSGGSSSGGSSLKWLKDDSKGLQVYTDAKDLSGFTRSIKGTNNVSYVVPSGVTVKTMIIKIDNTVFAAGQSEAQTLTFDANGVICGSDTHRFPVFTSYIDENGNATVQHEFEIDQNGTLSTKSIVWNGTMDDKLVGFASGELVLYVRLDF